MTGTTAPPDVFAEINSRTIADLWSMLGLPGEPKPRGNVRSPFHEDKKPSFSIHGDGFKWKDHSGTDNETGGDGVAFVMAALRCDAAEARRWWQERHGIDILDGQLSRGMPRRTAATVKPPEDWKAIQWPGELVEGTAETWSAFAAKRGLSPAGVSFAVRAGVLRFLKIDGRAAYAITDSTRRAAEIRDWHGRPFGSTKAFPLTGCSKRWLPGLAHAVTSSPASAAGIFVTEGATDLLTALDAYHRWKTQGGASSWIPAAILGAGCKVLAPEAENAIRGRRVRMCPDGDDAGRAMAKHWREVFKALGCTVDTLKMPEGEDLSSVAGKLKLEGLFSV